MSSPSLKYIVREPAVGTGARPPVLVLLHGVRSNEQDLMGLAPVLDPRFYLVSARAPITLGPGAYGWYHVEFTADSYIIDEDEAERGVQLVLQFLHELPQITGVDESRIYLMGFSQGAIMTVGSAVRQPQLFAGAVAMSGRLLPSFLGKAAPPAALRDLPLLAVHGVQDTVIPVEDGRNLRDELQRLPVAFEYKEYNIAHQVSAESMRDIGQWLTARLDSKQDWRTAAA